MLTREMPTYTIKSLLIGQGRWNVAHPGRILVVDDEPKIRSFIGRALANAGYAADFSGNGADAVASAQQTRYDLVILDLVMPDLDGRQVLGKLLAARPDQAVIMLVLRGRRGRQGRPARARRPGLPDQAVLAGRAARPGAGCGCAAR